WKTFSTTTIATKQYRSQLLSRKPYPELREGAVQKAGKDFVRVIFLSFSRFSRPPAAFWRQLKGCLTT
ncbi:MAG: hypothetical protein ACE5HO_01705, partial [bacterium]